MVMESILSWQGTLMIAVNKNIKSFYIGDSEIVKLNNYIDETIGDKAASDI